MCVYIVSTYPDFIILCSYQIIYTLKFIEKSLFYIATVIMMTKHSITPYQVPPQQLCRQQFPPSSPALLGHDAPFLLLLFGHSGGHLSCHSRFWISQRKHFLFTNSSSTKEPYSQLARKTSQTQQTCHYFQARPQQFEKLSI